MIAPRRTLVLGGTRSGKSRHAEDLLPADAPVCYVATARVDPDDAGAWARPDVPAAVGRRMAELVDAVAACAGTAVLVSAEVGLGVVPATRAGRLFRDELGALNAALAAACDQVLLLVAGLPLRLK